MVVGHADSAGATAQAGADRDALAAAVGSAAGLRLGTLGIGRAGVARQRLATGAVIGVAVEAADALAGGAVVDSHALRVGRALGALAYRCALLHLERIGQTGMCDGTIIRAGALGHARALAAVGARILLEAIAAEADWARSAHRAHLVLVTEEGVARVEALLATALAKRADRLVLGAVPRRFALIDARGRLTSDRAGC